MPRRFVSIGWFGLAMIIALPLLLAAETPSFQKSQIAILEVGAGRLDWLPQVDYESLVLTVSGPANLYLHYEFGPGQAPYLSLIDAKGDRLPDGTYAYELRTVPRLDRESRERLSRPRETGDESPKEELQRGGRLPAEALVQSGFFSIKDGSFVQGSRRTGTKPSKPPLQSVTEKLVDDDLVIQGNACIGSECASNGNDYSVLKLNATQPNILFDDVEPIGSSSSPFNDWALFINPFDAAQFAIADFEAQTVPFSVIGGAPDNSLLISENGNVGLGTATPGAKLHIFGSATADAIGSAGPDPVSGPAFNFGYAGTSIGRGVGFLNVRPDASAVAPNPSLRFFTANVERMIITNTGNIGIGASSPEAKLHVFGSSTSDTIICMGPNCDGSPGTESAFNIFYAGATSGRGAGALNVRPDSGATAPNPSLRFFVANVERVIIDNEGFIGLGVANPTSPIHHSSGAILTAGGTWQNASSRDLKRDIAKLATDEALTTLQGLDPVKFAYKVDPKERHVGFIAEDVPDLVAAPDRKSLSSMDILAVLTKVVQEQQKTIDALSATVGELRTKLEEIAKGRPEATEAAGSLVRMP